MANYTAEEYRNMIWILAEFRGNARQSIRRYAGAQGLPCARTIREADRRLRETGSVFLTAGYSGAGRDRSVTMQQEDQVLDAVHQNPGTSIRRISRETGLARSQVIKLPS